MPLSSSKAREMLMSMCLNRVLSVTNVKASWAISLPQFPSDINSSHQLGPSKLQEWPDSNVPECSACICICNYAEQKSERLVSRMKDLTKLSKLLLYWHSCDTRTVLRVRVRVRAKSHQHRWPCGVRLGTKLIQNTTKTLGIVAIRNGPLSSIFKVRLFGSCLVPLFICHQRFQSSAIGMKMGVLSARRLVGPRINQCRFVSTHTVVYKAIFVISFLLPWIFFCLLVPEGMQHQIPLLTTGANSKLKSPVFQGKLQFVRYLSLILLIPVVIREFKTIKKSVVITGCERT